MPDQPELRALRRRAADMLARAGVPSPAFDADELLCHVLGTRRGELALVRDIDPAQRAAWFSLLERRAAREPLQHLTGLAHFRHLDLVVGPGVFVPRPETEVLVDAIGPLRPGSRVVELCAGSGAISLSLATESPGIEVWAIELDPAAFKWLQRNLARHATAIREARSQLAVVLGDATRTGIDFLTELWGSVDVVVSNPPYVPTGAVPVDPEVAQHDPQVALYAGSDGLDVIRPIAQVALGLLRAGGLCAIEHGCEQGADVSGVMAGAGMIEVETRPDLSGRDRITLARR